MSAPRPAIPDDASIIRTVQASRAAFAAGRTAEAEQLLVRIAQVAPGHPAVLNELGVVMMSRGAAEQAHAMFDRATQVEAGQAALWSNLASSLRALGRRQEEREALEKALALEPRHLASLLQKAALLEELGDVRNAARLFQQALTSIPPGSAPPPAVRELVEHARQVVEADQASLSVALEERLGEIRTRYGGQAQRRVDRCLEMSTGRRTAYFPRPTFMYFPEIPAIEFFDRADFPWLTALEAATDDIRNELTNVMIADREGLQAYIDFPAGLPIEQWKDLNHSRRWSAYFLWNQGTAVAPHLARCPKTAAALSAVPRCDVPGRAPTAFFSILDAATTIPPHTGVTNTRLTVHLPLIVPPKCRFRVGGTTREWEEGKAWVFDDTIEHEAWNDSDTPRAVLIFDIWNPFLSDVERDMVRAATEVITTYYQLPAEGQL
ncbi:MAG: aspartate beta-hydroxylase [Gammaproteobacteria bacterium]|nr:aspartate beta-hydroxylase [Gammaproteobacteria bacterium]